MTKIPRVRSSDQAVLSKKLDLLTLYLEKDPQGVLEQTRALLDIHSDHIELLAIAADAARRLGEVEQALLYAESALEQKMHSLPALRVRGQIELDRGNIAEAVPYFMRAVDAHPEDVKAFVLLSHALVKLKRFDEFFSYYDGLSKKLKTNSVVLNNYGQALLEIARVDEGLLAFEQSIKKDPNYYVPRANRIVALHYSPNYTPEDILKECRRFQRQLKPSHPIRRARSTNLVPNRRLRIGMISGGFSAHPVGSMITHGLMHVKRDQIEFYAYSTSRRSDHITEKIKNVCSKWVVVDQLTDKELDALIREDEIDILFDLSGYNDNSRMTAIMMEPAPIIVKWVGGLISSTGVDAIDYLLSDRIQTPPDVDALYTEKLIRLPDDYICFEPALYTPPVNDLPAKINGYVTFGCFNNASKINNVLLENWAKILDQVQQARLFLKSHAFSSTDLQERVVEFFEQRGITKDRIRLEGASPHRQLLACYNDVDIALDPWPYSGGLTTCEALVMGVPVITMPGPTFAGRHSATHLFNAGMPELIADSWEQYIQLATSLANDLDNLEVIRQNLRYIVLQSPLCDAERFSQSFTNAMRAIWQRHCAGEAPEALVLGNDLTPYFADGTEPVALLSAESADNSSSARRVNQETTGGFRFELIGRIVTVDNGTNLIKTDKFLRLKSQSAFQFILFDPAGAIDKQSIPIDVESSIQHFPFHGLGDGEKSTLYATLDPSCSSTLAPIGYSPDAPKKAMTANSVVAEIQVFSVNADAIPGLRHIDWLLLSARHAVVPILARSNMLTQALVVQVNLPIPQMFQGQPSVESLVQHMQQVGFDLYRIDGADYCEGSSDDENYTNGLTSTRMTEYALLFIPNRDRVRRLTPSECERLAFIAHFGYGMSDLAYELLALSSAERAQLYLKAQTEKPKSVNSLPPVTTKKHALPGRLIVSLTSYPARFKGLAKTLRTLLAQTVRPDRLILWVAHSDVIKLPKEVTALSDHGLDIQHCEDIGSFKKLIPTLKHEANAFIAIADDDILYPTNWLEKLTETWSGDYDEIVAGRAHKIRVNEYGKPAPYLEWEWNYRDGHDKSHLIFPTGCGGVLFPPRSFHRDVTNQNLFMRLCPTADDIWLYWMCVLNNKKYRLVGEPFDLKVWDGSQEDSLWNINKKGNNDKQFAMVAEFYGTSARQFLKSAYEALTLQKKATTKFLYNDIRVFFHLPDKSDHIQSLIRSHGDFYERKMLEDIAHRAEPGGVIIDVGANVGNHTVFFGLFCNSSKVLSFEPQEHVFNVLCKNVLANGLERKVDCYKLGVGAETSNASLSEINPANLGMTKLSMDHVGEVSVIDLDSFIYSEDLQGGVTVMKIDVEGMEMDVLTGARTIIQHHRPYLYVEAANDENLLPIVNFLSPLGYRVKSRFNATATYLFIPDIA